MLRGKNSAQEVFQRLGVKSLSAPAAAREYAALLEIQPHGVLLLAADECRRKGWNLEEMHWLLERWKSKGLENEQDVQEYLNKRKGLEGLLREVFEACGHRGNPTAADLILVVKPTAAVYHDAVVLSVAVCVDQLVFLSTFFELFSLEP